MGFVRKGSSLAWVVFLFLGFLGAGSLLAHWPPRDRPPAPGGGKLGSDDGTEPGETTPSRVYGSIDLEPVLAGDPPAPVDEDAAGKTKVFQVGDRMALHVHVRHLEPGVTYKVLATCPPAAEGGEPTVEELGSITTRPDVVPPPYCFLAKLKAPEPPSEGEGGRLRSKLRPPRKVPSPGGMAVFHRNREATQLRYRVVLWGVGEGAAATLVLSAEKSHALAPNEEGKIRGTIDLAEGDLAALASGEAKVVVTVTETPEGGEPVTTEVLSGTVKACCPWFDKLRERFAKIRAGTGSLRLDTAREDTMPCGVTEAMALVGVKITVVDPAGNAILEGTFTEDSFKVCVPPAPPEKPGEGQEPGDGGEPGDGTEPGPGEGASLAEEAQALSLLENAAFFGISEVHDASFIRGDFNDDGRVDIADAISSLNYLFRAGASPYCADAADADDSGGVDIADSIFTLMALFHGGKTLPLPYPSRGFDPTADGLFCSQ